MRIDEVNPTTFHKLTHQTINQLQIIMGAMDQHEPKLALNACKRIHELTDKIRSEIMGIKVEGVF